MEYRPTICPYCGCGCGIYLVINDDGKIIGVEPWKDHPVNEGTNCIKGKNAYQYIYSEDRVTSPLIKENGAFREATWDEALDLVAAHMRDTAPNEMGFIASGHALNEDAYVFQKLARTVMQTNNIEYCTRFCHSPTVAGLGPTLGSGLMQTTLPDLDQADYYLVFGTNLKETFPMIARRLIQAQSERGAKITVIDPRKTTTARHLADTHLQLHSSTDVHLINAMMKIILDEGLADEDFIAAKTEGIDTLKEHLAALDLDEVERVTEVPLDDIKKAARDYADAETGCILYNLGITEHSTGSDNVKALADLALLTGHIGKPGSGVNSLRGQLNGEGTGDMGCLNAFYPGFKKMSPEAAATFQKLWQVEKLPSKPGLDYMSILHQCKTVYMMGANPAFAAPDANNTRAALAAIDFLVVEDMHITETARYADVILPPAVWVEKEGTKTWMDRRVQKMEKLIDSPGETKPDWWIVCRLAEKMGYKDLFPYNSAREVFAEIRTCVPQYKGITYERLEANPTGVFWPCPAEDHPGTPTMFVQGFPTPSGKANFVPVSYKPPAEVPDAAYPFYLTTGRTVFLFHTGMATRTPRLAVEVPHCYVQVNPADAAENNIGQGDPVTVKTRRGSIEVEAKVTGEVPPGMLFLPLHFGDDAANFLTNTAFDPACKMPELKVCAATLEVS